MAARTTTQERLTNSWNNAKTKDAYYQPKRIHYVTEGLKSVQSARQYLYQFNIFLKYLGLKPGNDDDLVKLLTKDPEEIEEIISDFLIHLKEKKHLKGPSINLAKSAIVHFFKRNRIRLNKDWISGFIPSDENYRKDRPYTHDEIQRLIDACSEDRIKVAIYLMSSTAMRVGTLTYQTPQDMPTVLEYGDLTWIPEHKLYKIDVYSRSRDHQYITYCSSECASMINRYLDYRRKCGEVITDTSPLIREQFDRTDRLAVTHPRKIMETTLTKTIRLAVKKAGLAESLKHAVKQTHGFRKFAISTMVKAGLKESYRRYLTGHAQVGQDRSYVLPTDEQLLSEYLVAMPLLTIDRKQRLEQENQELRKSQKDYLAELGELREEFDQIKQWLVYLRKDTSKKLVNEFHQRTGDEVQEAWWASEDYKDWMRSKHPDYDEVVNNKD